MEGGVWFYLRRATSSRKILRPFIDIIIEKDNRKIHTFYVAMQGKWEVSL